MSAVSARTVSRVFLRKSQCQIQCGGVVKVKPESFSPLMTMKLCAPYKDSHVLLTGFGTSLQLLTYLKPRLFMPRTDFAKAKDNVFRLERRMCIANEFSDFAGAVVSTVPNGNFFCAFCNRQKPQKVLNGFPKVNFLSPINIVLHIFKNSCVYSVNK